MTRATIAVISQKPVTLRGTIFSMISDSLRRACLLLLAVCCLGLDARHSPPDIFSLDEPRLARVEQQQFSAVVREAVGRAEALSEHQYPAGEKSFGSAAALPAESVLFPSISFQPAYGPAFHDGRFLSVASSYRARAPPLPA